MDMPAPAIVPVRECGEGEIGSRKGEIGPIRLDLSQWLEDRGAPLTPIPSDSGFQFNAVHRWLLYPLCLYAVAGVLVYHEADRFDWRMAAIAPSTFPAELMFPFRAEGHFGALSAAVFAGTFLLYFVLRKNRPRFACVFLLQLCNLALMWVVLQAYRSGNSS